MRIKISAGRVNGHTRGSVIELPDDEAAPLLAAGLAVPFIDEATLILADADTDSDDSEEDISDTNDPPAEAPSGPQGRRKPTDE